jgi:hypothetical protein
MTPTGGPTEYRKNLSTPRVNGSTEQTPNKPKEPTRSAIVLSPYDRKRIADINNGGPKCCTFHQALSARGGLSSNVFSISRYLSSLRRRGQYCGNRKEGDR